VIGSFLDNIITLITPLLSSKLVATLVELEQNYIRPFVVIINRSSDL
jgi:hypothetical protein